MKNAVNTFSLLQWGKLWNPIKFGKIVHSWDKDLEI